MGGVDFQVVGVGDVAFQRVPDGPAIDRIRAWRDGWERTVPTVVFGNLEIPLTTRGTPADKPATFRGPPAGAEAVAAMGFDVLSLANNHALDYGEVGARDTMAVVEAAKLQHVGIGVGAAAYRGRLRTVGGRKVAFLALCSTVPRGFAAAEGRLGVAPLRAHQAVYVDGALSDEQPGTSPRVQTWPHEPDVLRAEEAIRELRNQGADFVIVAVHWGVPPMWLAPYQGTLADYQRPMAERLVAAGADAIIGHHAHVPLTWEWLGGAPVFYSLGNFMFQPYVVEHPQDGPVTPGLLSATAPAAFHEGFVARLAFGANGVSAVSLATYVLDERGEPVAPSPERHAAIRERLHRPEHESGPAPVSWSAIEEVSTARDVA